MPHGLAIAPLTPERWPDLEALFGARGACAGCWCMYWRQRGKDWSAHTNEGNRTAFRAIVERGPPPGLLAYADDHAVAWCQVGPREAYARILAARVKQPLDARPTYVISCFFVAREWRGRGLMPRLIEAAVEFARAAGAARVEGFPLASDRRTADTFAYVGTPGAFRQAGFRRVVRRIAGKSAARYVVDIERS